MSTVSHSAGRRRAVVAGALGIVGASLVDHLLGSGWEVVGIARRAPPARADYRHLCLDLTDAAACWQLLGERVDTTHVFYCARAGCPDPAEEERVNLAMLRNLVEPLARFAGQLSHINLVHGTKWYGSHLGSYRTPAEEDDPRHPGPNFYYAQHDYLLERQGGESWTWSTVRPHIVCGSSVGYPFNLMTLLAAYGTLCAERGVPFDFPGTEACYHSISQATDVGLLCRAMLWAVSEPVCANRSFNIVNADYFRWSNVWPAIAAFFGAEPGVVRPSRLAQTMVGMDPVWDEIVRRHGLQPYALSALANWSFGDFLFRADWDDMSSMLKARQFGFQDVTSTMDMFMGILGEFRRDRLIPSARSPIVTRTAPIIRAAPTSHAGI